MKAWCMFVNRNKIETKDKEFKTSKKNNNCTLGGVFLWLNKLYSYVSGFSLFFSPDDMFLDVRW